MAIRVGEANIDELDVDVDAGILEEQDIAGVLPLL
jgi:hypothetical protein